MPNYSVDWNRYIRHKVPGALRKVVHLAWLNALVTPIKTVQLAFENYRAQVSQRLQITGQVRILRYWLNELYDPSDRRIDVIDSTAFETVFIFLESENMPVYLPRFIGGVGSDFTVILPEELRPYELFIRAFLNQYKLVTKSYIIIYQ